MARIIGVNSLHLAEVKTDTKTSSTWGTPTPVPSVMSVSISDQTEQVTFYSDDTVEQVLPSFASKEVTIELGYLTPEIEAMISGNIYKDVVYIQKENAEAKEFALLFKAPLSKGGAERYVCLYKGVLAKNDSEYQGKQDSIESSNVTLTGTFMPLTSNNKVEIKLDSNDTHLNSTTKALITNWFTTVPDFNDEELRAAEERTKK